MALETLQQTRQRGSTGPSSLLTPTGCSGRVWWSEWERALRGPGPPVNRGSAAVLSGSVGLPLLRML